MKALCTGSVSKFRGSVCEDSRPPTTPEKGPLNDGNSHVKMGFLLAFRRAHQAAQATLGEFLGLLLDSFSPGQSMGSGLGDANG